MLDRKFFLEYGPDLVACFRKHIFMDAKDVYGKPFKGYSDEYGQAKRTGTLFRQATEFKDSNAPVLTSDLVRDFKAFKSHSTGFGFGAIAQRGKVKNLARMGRVITTNQKPLPDKCSELLMKELDKDVKGAFKKIRKKIKRKKININIGR